MMNTNKIKQNSLIFDKGTKTTAVYISSDKQSRSVNQELENEQNHTHIGQTRNYLIILVE